MLIHDFLVSSFSSIWQPQTIDRVSPVLLILEFDTCGLKSLWCCCSKIKPLTALWRSKIKTPCKCYDPTPWLVLVGISDRDLRALNFYSFCSPPAGFMQNSSSMIFQIFPSGSHQASSLAILSFLKMPLTSASSTFMSPITGKSLSYTHKLSHVFIYSPIDGSLWSLGATCAVLQVSECRHGVALRSQWEQQYGGGHWLPATGMAVYLNTNCSHHCVATSVLFLADCPNLVFKLSHIYLISSQSNSINVTVTACFDFNLKYIWIKYLWTCGISQNVKDDPQKRHTRVSDVKRVYYV